jgi:hypothetical protein
LSGCGTTICDPNTDACDFQKKVSSDEKFEPENYCLLRDAMKAAGTGLGIVNTTAAKFLEGVPSDSYHHVSVRNVFNDTPMTDDPLALEYNPKKDMADILRAIKDGGTILVDAIDPSMPPDNMRNGLSGERILRLVAGQTIGVKIDEIIELYNLPSDAFTSLAKIYRVTKQKV